MVVLPAPRIRVPCNHPRGRFMGRLMTTIEARYERTPVFTSNHEGRVLILPSLRFFWAEHTSEGHQRGSSLAHEVIIRTVDMRLNYISTGAPSLVPTSCTSVQKSNLQRSCLECISLDTVMDSTSTCPIPVRSGTEGGVPTFNESPSSIGHHRELSPHRSSDGCAQRHVYAVFPLPGPLLKCSPVPQIRPSADIRDERMT